MKTMAMPTPETDMQEAAVVVRLASVNDLCDLVGLYKQLAGDRVAALPADPVKAKSLLEVILEQSGRQLLVAEVDHHVVGTIDLLIVPNLTHGGALGQS